MFKSNYVLALIANGRVLEEDNNRKVRMPFGQEYKTRLINKHYKRCACDLIVDGEKVARFVINAGETADIERFVDGSNSSGRRFKFVSIHDSAVKDKNNIEAGIVEAHFYLEKDKPIEHHHHHYHERIIEKPIYPPWKPYEPYWCYTNNGGTFDLNCDPTIGGGPAMSFNCCSAKGMSAGDVPGATVRGSESDQKFSDVFGLEFESEATILKLKIINGDMEASVKYCTGCGRKKKHGDKYCSNCGSQY